MGLRILLASAAIGAMSFAAGAAKADINVLWYTGGVGTSSGGVAAYDTAIDTLAAPMAGDPAAAATADWNITFWSSGAMPTGAFNVLVVASPEGGWGPPPNYSALESAGLTASSFGDRVMLTGQDADWHFTNFPGPANFDGPRGFLRDGVSWAGSGKGLGLVVLGDNGNGSNGAADFGFSGFTAGSGSNEVTIPATESGFPINGGLTSAGLSGWNTAAHVGFRDLDTSVWNGINVNAGDPSDFVTIVSAATAGGGTGGTIPEPSTWVMMLAGFAGLAYAGYRKSRTSAAIAV